MIGLYGMGGVGKTTLLKKINNHFLATSTDFEVVIWAVVSKSPNIENIQEVIWNKLQIPRGIWETRSSNDEKAAEIFRVLSTKKFVLLLDDVWERLGLLEIGVPCPDAQNKSKIVFTTRSKDVCHQMKAQKSMEVACLASEAAWTLFQKEVGEETLNSHPHILMLAKVVAQECKGLPLALITLGRAMAQAKDPSNWDKVIQDLRKFPAEISGMEDEVFRPLKLSYDRLYDNVIKSCFIYCSIFPEDYAIYNEQLIELWIGEGFLSRVHDIHEARDQGRKIINNLKHACLWRVANDEMVKMHDLIRDMALWLYSECGMEKNKVLVCNKVSGLKEVQEISKWKEAERMSLWDRNVEKLPETLLCPNLKTLFVRECYKLKTIPSGFFQFIPLLRVLDLSRNHRITELPAGIGELKALEYLNLSSTGIRELPIELKNLKNLASLFLDEINGLRGHEETLLEELEALNSISEVTISITSALSISKLKSCDKLQRRIWNLYLVGCGDLISLELSSSFLERSIQLERLDISGCDELKDVKINVEREGRQGVVLNDVPSPIFTVAGGQYFHILHRAFIGYCPKILDLTYLIYAPYLESLSITCCESMEEVIRDDGGVSEVEAKSVIFTRLKDLSLSSLPTLKSLYQHPLLFPSLETVEVYSCPRLRRLPFDSNTATNRLKKIEGEESWWNMLQWEDSTVKDLTNFFDMGCPTLFPLGLYSFSGAQVPFPRGLRLGLLLVLSVCWSVAVGLK
ncbi:putative disease resistance protein [Vitis vinifera]|uniref:Putative disease resistance protein n=1 Tax=Vitis vinifera TaxID=29760 RepID=A0A438GZH3_VITVI|nr:putative disease resistance protein [Vitis vinifera]